MRPAAAGSAELVRRDLSAAPAVLSGTLESGSASGEVEAGVVALAVPFDEHWTMDVNGQDVPADVGFGALTAFDVANRRPAELGYETPSTRRAALFGQAVLWVIALVAASRLRLPAWTSRRAGRGDRRAVIDFADDVDLPTETGDVPVMVPLEPVGAGARQPVTSGRTAQKTTVFRSTRTLFRADDEAERAAWVDEMFADEDEKQ